MLETNWGKVTDGLSKYTWLMKYFEQNVDFSDPTFQRKFKGFYRIRRNQEFCDLYFKILGDNKNNTDLQFQDVVERLLGFGKLEASFSSKLLATINPQLPVWDREVLKHIKPETKKTFSTGDRVKDAVFKYNEIVEYYKLKVQSDIGKDMIKDFNTRYPDVLITDLKKIDLILWQTR